MRIGSDRRFREVLSAPDAERAAAEALRQLRLGEARAAEALATIEERRSYVRHGFRTANAWAESLGYGPCQASRLLSLGRSLLREPELGALLRSGAACAESVLLVGKVLREPRLELSAAERRSWIAKAVQTPPRQLREEAEQAIEDARQGAPTQLLSLHVTRGVRRGLGRARQLMSRGRRRRISEGETLGRLVGEWLVRNDPMLRPLPRRPAGRGSGRRSRYIPKRVLALVERRSEGRCEVCGHRRAMEKFHMRVPHARGGSTEAHNIGDACWECHTLVDQGVWVFTHFDGQGRPQFRFDPAALAAPRRRPPEVRERGPAYACRSVRPPRDPWILEETAAFG